jgi:tetratricopeptide (TPR) repeat protein
MSANPLRPIYVFIASPGDVPDSRSSVRYAVERINKLVAKDNGFLLEHIGWEDIPPGKRERTQDNINPHVDAASIFVGILHRRFGRPTQIAESGTEEEYNRIEKRWKDEDPKPEVLMYFKKIPDEQSADPGEQLQKVLAFKKRVEKTCLYKEYESEHELDISIQDALHDWIIKNRDTFKMPSGAGSLVTLEPKDKEMLACVIKQDQLTVNDICSQNNQPMTMIKESMQRLQNLGLVVEDAHRRLKPGNSTEGFLAIARHLNTDEYCGILLSSKYFQNMLNSSLEAHIQSRYHLKLDTNITECLQKIALLSSRATSILLFGDTSFYDNAFESVKNKNGEAQKFVNALMKNRIILNVLLEYGADYTAGRILTELKSKRLAGQLLTIDLKVAYEEALAFGLGTAIPMIGAVAETALNKAELCYGRPEFGIRTGIIYMHLELDELARQQFDQALSQNIPDSARSIGLNNKGLLYLKYNRIPEAILLFEQAIQYDPTKDGPKNNLEFAKTRLLEQKEK